MVRVDDQRGHCSAACGEAQLRCGAQDAGDLDDVLVLELAGHWMFLLVCAAFSRQSVFDGVKGPARDEQRVKTRSVTFGNIGGSPIVTPMFPKVSSFDALRRAGSVR